MNEKTSSFLTYFGLSLAAFAWISLMAAFLGVFYEGVLIAAIILILIGWLLFFLKNRDAFQFDRQLVILLSIGLVTVIVYSVFSSPSVFTGRDQGSLATAAIYLSQNHDLRTTFPAQEEFFRLYGPGLALNFPGFNYDQDGRLVSHFPLGYSSYLGAYYSLMGLNGFILANALAFLVFLFSFYAVARYFLKSSSSLIAVVLIITSFVFAWFFKLTLSENLALALAWFGLFQFLEFLKNEKTINFYAFLAAFGYLLMVRVEAFAFLLIALAIIYFKMRTRGKLALVLNKKVFLMIGALIVVTLISFKTNEAFYVTFAKGFQKSFTPAPDAATSEVQNWQTPYYVLRVFGAYGILIYLFLAAESFFLLWQRKFYEKLVPLVIFLPSFIYLLNPSISLDHPWMLRRFLFAVIPVCILYAVIFLEYFFQKKIWFYAFSIFLLAINLFVHLPYFTLSDHKDLLPQIEKLSENFGEKDLVLVDRDATGDPWAMMAGPLNTLYKKQAVYFFNPADLGKIETDKFENVYLIIPDENLDFYKDADFYPRLKETRNYFLEMNALALDTAERSELVKRPVQIPPYQKNFVRGKIYLLQK